MPTSWEWQCQKRADLTGDDWLRPLGQVTSLSELSVTFAYWLPSHILSYIPSGTPFPAQTSVKHVLLAIMANSKAPSSSGSLSPTNTVCSSVDALIPLLTVHNNISEEFVIPRSSIYNFPRNWRVLHHCNLSHPPSAAFGIFKAALQRKGVLSPREPLVTLWIHLFLLLSFLNKL